MVVGGQREPERPEDALDVLLDRVVGDEEAEPRSPGWSGPAPSGRAPHARGRSDPRAGSRRPRAPTSCATTRGRAPSRPARSAPGSRRARRDPRRAPSGGSRCPRYRPRAARARSSYARAERARGCRPGRRARISSPREGPRRCASAASGCRRSRRPGGPLHQREELVGVGREPGHLEAGLRQQAGKALAQDQRVVGDDYPHGISARTSSPVRAGSEASPPAEGLEEVGQPAQPDPRPRRPRRRRRRRSRPRASARRPSGDLARSRAVLGRVRECLAGHEVGGGLHGAGSSPQEATGELGGTAARRQRSSSAAARPRSLSRLG